VLILSEFAGAAEELKCGALLVNPYDSEFVASIIRTALEMDQGDQSKRMHAMRSMIRAHDVFRWAHSFNIGPVFESTCVDLRQDAQQAAFS
jgi:trehalose-6-phosphate synthase